MNEPAQQSRHLLDKEHTTPDRRRRRTIGDEAERDEIWIQAILAASPDGALLVNESGCITHVNSVLEELFGWTSEDLLGEMVEILLPDRLHGTHPQQVQDFLANPQPIAIGLRRNLYARHRDGHEIPVEVGLNPIALDDGIVVLAVVRDISDRVRLHERLELIFESAPTAMLMVDVARRIVLVNSLLEEIFGYRREELIGQTVELLVPPALREQHPGLVARFFEHPEHRKMGVGREVFGFRKNGQEFPCELALSPLQLTNQTYVIAVLADITERIRAEREFRLAREIQQAMMPQGSPHISGLDIAGKCSPANATGGDFFDYIQLPTGELVIVVADVSGHGFGPALLSATTKSFLRSLIMTQDSLSAAIARTNDLLVDETRDGQFVTLFALLLDPNRGVARYVGAGHKSFAFRSDGSLKLEMYGEGLPLGLEKGESYSLSDPIALEPGEIILAVTDGILDQTSPDGDHFGKERLFESVRNCCQFNAEEILHVLEQDTAIFRSVQPRADDITTVVVKVDT